MVVLHGFSGIFPAYRQFARELVDQGYVVMVLDYYVETGRLRPLLVLHGDADSIVPVSHAQTIHDTLTRFDKTVAMRIYPEAGHGFNIRGSRYNVQVAADAQKRAFAFLAKHLQPADMPSVSPSGTASQSQTLYDTAMHFYTVESPAQMVPGGNLDQLFALPVFDRTQYTYTDDRGQVYDVDKRHKTLNKFYQRIIKRGYTWFSAYKIERVEQTDDTHGTVTYTLMSSWEHADAGTRGLNLVPGVSSWEKQDGEWRIVATKMGRPYRVRAVAAGEATRR